MPTSLGLARITPPYRGIIGYRTHNSVFMKSINRRYIASPIFALIFMPAVMEAAIIVNGPTSSTGGSFQITTDITFTITKAGKVRSFVLDEWVTSDGTHTFAPFLSIVDAASPPLMISVNHGVPFANSYSHLIDNNYSWMDITHNDGYFYLDPDISVSIGDTVTIMAGTFALLPTSGFNPQATQVFTGNMFMTDTGNYRASNIVSVPEPWTANFLMGAVVATFAALRRRKG